MRTKEKRKLKRYTLRLNVYNQQSDKLIGYIEDVNIRGMNVKSIDRFPEMQEIKVWFGADDNPESQRVQLTVIKVWDAFTDTNPRLFNTGLHFIDPSDEALDLLQDMISKLKGNFVNHWGESTHV